MELPGIYCRGMRILPYGTWPSPLTPEAVATGQVRIDEVRVDGPDTYWLETRPAEAGRQALVHHDGTAARDVLPVPWDVRTRVHEYGGGAFDVENGVVVFSSVDDGVVFRLDPGTNEPVPLTTAGACRFGGLVLRGSSVYAVREDHSRTPEPANELVRIPTDGLEPGAGTVLFSGTDFVSRPAVSADGAELAWVVWNHPDMPWDSTRLLRASVTADGLGEPRLVAGGDGVSVAQPHFGPDGALWFVGDETGWWLVHRDAGDGPVRLHDAEADFARAGFTLGLEDLPVLDADHALVRWWEGTGTRLGVLDARTGRVHPVDGGGSVFEDVVAADGEVAGKRGRPDRLPEVVRGPALGPFSVLGRSSDEEPDPAWVSPPQPWSWRDSAGLEVHGILHEPVNPEVAAPTGAVPPLVVMAHGGPTSRFDDGYNTATQFWTTRGYAVLLVNYSGSTGHGRAYRERLLGRWGELDIDDCVTGAVSLGDAGRVDRSRLVVRGGSAGGFVVLRAMTTSAVFAAGTSLFGVTDLAGLARETHKLESHYTDRLVAPWPDGEAVYRERSPLYAADRLHGELLMLQGDDDHVVPLTQAEEMADAMRRAGREVELHVYEGEGHGFRRRESIVDAMERELAFYTRVLRLESPGPPPDPRSGPPARTG
jgi:dipeptidyl aminopeptidase/acylaminoacyl peptidase